MANKKNIEDVTVTTEEFEEEEEVKELNYDKKIVLRSIAPWTTGFSRIEGNGDVNIAPKGTVRLTIGEVISQARQGNRLILGTDEIGSHATLIIEDADTREELEFDSKIEKRKQLVLTIDVVKKLFEYKQNATFEKELKKYVVTRAEKFALIEFIKELYNKDKSSVGDIGKIATIQRYTGLNVDL